MNIKDIKSCDNKTPIDGLRGIVEAQYPPSDQTAKDIEFNQHRQSMLVNDGAGNKVIITLMRKQIHILDSIEGHEITLTAGRNDKGELRGLLVNKWQKPGAQYESVVVKVYPEATIRATPPGASTVATPAPEPEQSAKPAPAPAKAAPVAEVGTSAFEREIALVAYGYCLCLDTAQEMVADRPTLQSDPGSIRAIATNLWMSSKHHVHTLAPGLNKTGEVTAGKAAPPRVQSEDSAARKATTSDTPQVIIDRMIKGYRALEGGVETFSPKAQQVLNSLAASADELGLWDKAYDQVLTGLIAKNLAPEGEVRAATNQVYDDMKPAAGGHHGVEKLIVTGQIAWQENVVEQLGRNG